MLDHLVYACPDLDEGVEAVEALLGVEATPGGRHEGLGTRNALVGLGPRSYLEVVSVDPGQPEPRRPRWFGLDELREPRLVTWAVATDRLDDTVRRASAVGLDLGETIAGARRRPDGRELRWVFTDPRADRLGGVVPFFIDWGDGAHPAELLATRCAVAEVSVEHPDPDRVREVLTALGLDATVSRGPGPAVRARLEGRRGAIVLR